MHVGVGRMAIRPYKNWLCGNSSVGRAPAFQAGGRGFEPRFPLFADSAESQDRNCEPEVWRNEALVAQLAEHFLGKEEVTGSIPVEGSYPH